MRPAAAVVLLAAIVVLLVVPRRWASIPLIAGTCYLGFAPGVELASFSFTALRLLITFGFLKALLVGPKLPGGLHGLDRLMLIWACWTCTSSLFHEDPRADLITKLGNLYDACGLYFLFRVFCASFDDVVRVCKSCAFILIPVALGMLVEQFTMNNLFSVFGSTSEISQVRDGKIRAFGPFVHPILAGTAGAATFPIFAGLWWISRPIALIGGIACLTIVLCSTSSGPVMSLVIGMGALWWWKYRRYTRTIRWAFVVVYILLDAVMKAPAYYLIARIDITGSSTGWHRAALIESSIAHLSEWWLAGTDYTRHWMPTGVVWSPNHTDITNQYLQMGVNGGLPLMLLYIGMIGIGFRYVRWQTGSSRGKDGKNAFLYWGLGSALFAHAATFISVNYFDQCLMFIYLTLALVGSGYHKHTEPPERRAAGLSCDSDEDLASAKTSKNPAGVYLGL